MKAVGQKATLAAEDAVEPSGQAHTETLHSAGHVRLLDGFDDQMDVVRLHGELADAHAESFGSGGERLSNRTKRAPRTEARNSCHHAPCDVDGQSASPLLAARVALSGSCVIGLAARMTTPTAATDLAMPRERATK